MSVGNSEVSIGTKQENFENPLVNYGFFGFGCFVSHLVSYGRVAEVARKRKGPSPRGRKI